MNNHIIIFLILSAVPFDCGSVTNLHRFRLTISLFYAVGSHAIKNGGENG